MIKLRSFFFIFFIALGIPQWLFSQSKIFEYVFRQDFQDDTPGNYSITEWKGDWVNPNWSESPNGLGVIKLENLNKYLQESFPPGSFFMDGSGVWWITLLNKGYDELYLNYRIKFSTGFLTDELHSKMPGFSGGTSVAGGSLPTGTDGWSARYMLKSGYMYFYLYYPEMYKAYGDDEPIPGKTYWGHSIKLNAPLQPNKWYSITQRIVMNTPGYHDGLVEGYVDGKLVAKFTNMRFRDVSSLTIDRIFWSMFLGGSGKSPIKNEFIDFDDFSAFSYNSNLDIPRGTTPSPTGRELFLPIKEYFDPVWIKTFTASLVSSKSVSLRWKPYMTSVTYTIERKLPDDPSYTAIATLNYDQTSYIDNSVALSSTYLYRIKAGQVISEVRTINTNQDNTAPNPPSDLTVTLATENSISLSWSDNSNDETGFELERSIANQDNFTVINSISPNLVNYTDASLLQETIYYYRIRAYNALSHSSYSNMVFATTIIITPPPPPPPDTIIPPPPPDTTNVDSLFPGLLAPSGLKIVDQTTNSVTLQWNDNSLYETGFLIRRGHEPDFNMTDYKLVQTANTTFTDEELIPGTSYRYVVCAKRLNIESPESNSIFFAAESIAESRRSKEGLVAYYNFSVNPEFVIRDLSDYNEPLDLYIDDQNSIEWTSSNKLNVLDNTIIRSSTPANKIIEACKSTNEITIECWIKSSEQSVLGNTRILSLSNSDNDLAFALGQTTTQNGDRQSYNYFVQLQTESTGSAGLPHLVTSPGLENANMHQIVYVKDLEGNEVIYLDGIEMASSFRPLGFYGWNSDYTLNFANEISMDQPWLGTFYLVAIYNKALDVSSVLKNFEAKPFDNITSNCLNMEINVFPNPTNGKFSVEIIPKEEFDYSQDTYLRLLNSFGQVIVNELVFNPATIYFKEFNRPDLTKGIYMLQLISDDNTTTKKIIIY